MKHLFRAAAISLFVTAIVVLPLTVSAEDHAAHHPPTAQASSSTESAMTMGKMGSDSMKKMQEQMAAIRATKDPKERVRLMDEHMQSMQGAMKAMQEKGGCEMKHEGMMMKHTDASTEAHEHGEHHQCMMEDMMEQMMQHMQAMKETPK